MEYLRRIVNCGDYEYEYILDDLPSIEAIVEYFELYCDVYGTEYLAGIRECIAEGASPKPLQKFIKKYKLNWTVA